MFRFGMHFYETNTPYRAQIELFHPKSPNRAFSELIYHQNLKDSYTQQSGHVLMALLN